MKKKMSWVGSGMLVPSLSLIGGAGLVTVFLHGWWG